MLIHSEAMIKIAHHQRVDELQLRQQQSQQPQRVHGTQRVGGVRLQQRLLQIQPQFRAPRRHRGQRGKGLLNAVLRGRAQLQAVVRHEVKHPQQHFGILQGRRLLQKDESIHHRKIRGRQPRAPALHLPVQRRPRFRNFFQQLRYGALHGARVPEVNPHPVGSREFFRIRGSNSLRRRFVLRLPAQRVVVAAMAEVQKAARRHQEIQRRFELLAHRSPQRTRIRPVVQLIHR